MENTCLIKELVLSWEGLTSTDHTDMVIGIYMKEKQAVLFSSFCHCVVLARVPTQVVLGQGDTGRLTLFLLAS